LALAGSAAIAQQDVQPAQRQAVQPQLTPGAAGRLTTDATTSTMMRVDGSRVVDVSGQPLGRIENIVLSPVGCAEAAILTAPNGRLVPIPWALVRVSGDTRVAGAMPGANLVFTVNADQASLAQAPSFVRTQWPDMSSQAWLQPSIAFFGAPNAAGVGATGAGANAVTGNETGIGTTTTTGAGVEGTTATGSTNQSRFGTTATTVPTNSTATRLPPGSTATRVPTNSTSVLPPTGRPNPGFPAPNRPPENRPPSGVPPTAPPPTAPPTQP